MCFAIFRFLSGVDWALVPMSLCFSLGVRKGALRELLCCLKHLCCLKKPVNTNVFIHELALYLHKLFGMGGVGRPTQSITYVPFLVSICISFLLVIQYKYLISCVEDQMLQDLIPAQGYAVLGLYSTWLNRPFPPDDIGWMKMFYTS